MRFVLAKNLKKGMILSREIMGVASEIAYADGTRLKNHDVEEIQHKGHIGGYILDNVSEGIVPEELLAWDRYIELREAISESYDNGEKAFLLSNGKIKNIIDSVLSVFGGSTLPLLDEINTRPVSTDDFSKITDILIIAIALGIHMEVEYVDLIVIADYILSKGYKVILDESKICDNKKDPLFKRIVNVASGYKTQTSKHHLKTTLFPYQALEAMHIGIGRKYDPTVVRALEKFVVPYPTGTTVELTNGIIGIVSENHRDDLHSPTIITLTRGFMDKLKAVGRIDLRNEEKLGVQGII